MMQNRLTYYLLIVATITLSSSCGGGSEGPETPPVVPEGPESALLIKPLKNEECNEGEIISENNSKVDFEWNPGKNATKYTIVLTNLNTNQSTNNNTNSTKTTITLLRGVPYSWNVISKSSQSSETATSETWKFFNAGKPVENYVPFPADLVNPPMGGLTNSTVTLEWVGSDIDNDIESYDVYLGEVNPPTELYKNTTSLKIENVTLKSGTLYYWVVVSKDAHGNNSNSPVFEFRTQ